MRRGVALLVSLFCVRLLNAADEGERAEASLPAAPPAAPTVAPAELAAGIAAMELRLSRIEASLVQIGDSGSGLRSEIEQIRQVVSAPARPAVGNESDVRRAQERMLARLDHIESLLGAPSGSNDSPLGYPRLTLIAAGLAAALSLGAILSVVLLHQRPGAGASGSIERRLNEIREALAHHHDTEPSADKPARPDERVVALTQANNALRTAIEASARDSSELREIIEQLRALEVSLRTAAEMPGRQAGQSQAPKDPSETNELETALSTVRALQARLSAFDAIWPETLRDDGPLAATKERMLGAVAGGDAKAADLVSALLRWHLVRTAPERDRDRWIEAAHAVGRASLAWQVSDDTAPPEGEALELAQAWARTVKAPLEEAFPALRLTAVYPGDRFDSDRMEAVGSISGGRQVVRRALSWSTLEKTSGATLVLRRAEVITA